MPGAITVLLQRYGEGDHTVEAELITQVYGELKRLARIHLRRSPRDRTLQPTALVHEAYLKLAGTGTPQWHDRGHFFRVASRAMRQVITDYARARLAEKRGGEAVFVPLEESRFLQFENPALVLQVHEAMERLAEADPRAHQVVELRCYGGLSVEEVAEVMQASPRTVKRDWRAARAWLMSELRTGDVERCSEADGSASGRSSKVP